MLISTPFVKIDLNQVETNIKDMVQRLNKNGIQHRPHIKPHKSIEFAKLQLSLGASGITCAKIAEAEVMAEGGIDDILIAFPIIGEKNLNRISKLAQKVDLKLIVDSYIVAQGLSKVGEKLNKKVKVLIEIDGGIHRGGVQPGQPTLDFAKEISSLNGIEIVGLFTYMGQIYGQSSINGIEKMAKLESQILLSNKELLESNGFEISITSGGSTPSSLSADYLKGISESRAGNYIFFDMNAVCLGVVDQTSCALKVCSTVVSTPFPGYATIDAGSKALSTDTSLKYDTYGNIAEKPDVRIVKLNEEHGFLQYNPLKYTFNVGDQVEIIPNHSCVIPNLNNQVYGFRNGAVESIFDVDARGRNY